MGTQMVPLYAVRIEDLGPGDFIRVDCAGCSHTALLAPVSLNRLGVLDLQDRVRCRACGARGRAVVTIKWARSAA
jgi:ribosomal protein S27E